MFKKFLKEKNAEKSLIGRFKFFFAGLLSDSFKVLVRDFLRNKIIRWTLFLSLGFNLANWLALRIFIEPVDLPIILHYNVYFGVDIFGNWKEAFFSPAIGLTILLINSSLALFFYNNKERIIGHILLLSSLMIQLLMLIYSISLIVINY